MERTPTGTTVGVDDPYDHADRCDHLTSDGRCRFALERAGDGGGRRSPSSRPSAGDDPEFAAARRAEGYDCVVAGDAEWCDCPHYRSTTDGRECRRCGLDEVRMAHDDARPLLEEHHLSYGGADDGDGPTHEITVALCRWCHAKVHAGWARIDDGVNPDAEALAAREERRSAERAEFGFRTAAERDDRE
ncbi:DUF7097 family protein [Haloplanus pelagicus]|jgi:hypothetical protein|uniref:DUF7097 family protein n=1 Tax=Haloplanus pelagicus TaxID=2949995 RepID=UPI00203BB5B0|nr:hypothetical protein [Haloplanus sp. HW8-1]